ncbi:hypothetical protein ACQPYH_09905 [Kribbella sp. CA-245084]|uniref:hypothetical protein n=1 Tax=Kribbella sp. CA-245084 TaxID=3239940 RepID=UPI003D94CCE1
MDGGDAIGWPISPSAANGLWSARRRRLQAALGQRDELFADLYRRAIDSLNEQPLRRGSLVIAGHCIRDLVNGLPDVLADVDSVPPYSPMSKPARELSEVWAEHEDILGPAEMEDTLSEDGRVAGVRVTVPGVVVQAARRVVVASRTGELNARQRHSALVLGRVEVRLDASVKVFRESVAIFERLRHPQRGRDVTVSAETLPRLVKALEIIEGALEGRMGSFFAAVEDLGDILHAANERDGVDGQ